MITAEEKVNRYGCHYTYYHCTKKKAGVPCHQKNLNLAELEKQFICILQKIHVPQIFLEMALNYLKEKEGTESAKMVDVRRSQEKALIECQMKLDNLNQMRLRDLIDDEEYKKEKNTLSKEKVSLELHLNNDSRKSSFDLTREVFILAAHALERFIKGTWKEKRAVIRNLRSNFFLKDKILTIQAQKPLQIIEKGIQEVNNRNTPLEPEYIGSTAFENRDFVHAFDSWCTRVEDVRTFYENLPESENSLLSF
jgi:hypothetical protein